MITLDWKPNGWLGITYYYTFYKEMILCVNAENVVDGVIKDQEFGFAVTVSDMDPDTGRGDAYINDPPVSRSDIRST